MSTDMSHSRGAPRNKNAKKHTRGRRAKRERERARLANENSDPRPVEGGSSSEAGVDGSGDARAQPPELPHTWVELIGYLAFLASNMYARATGKKWAQVLMIYLPFFVVVLLFTGLLGATVYFVGNRQLGGALGVSAGTLLLGVVAVIVRYWLRRR